MFPPHIKLACKQIHDTCDKLQKFATRVEHPIQGMNSLPPEIISQVFENLDNASLKSCRLGCKGFAVIATPGLFRFVRIWMHASSLQRLMNISRTEFNGLVKELILDPLEFDQDLFNDLTEYEDEIEQAGLPMLPEHEIRLAQSEYRQMYEENRHQREAGIHMAMLSSAFTLLPNLETLRIEDDSLGFRPFIDILKIDLDSGSGEHGFIDAMGAAMAVGTRFRAIEIETGEGGWLQDGFFDLGLEWIGYLKIALSELRKFCFLIHDHSQTVEALNSGSFAAFQRCMPKLEHLSFGLSGYSLEFDDSTHTADLENYIYRHLPKLSQLEFFNFNLEAPNLLHQLEKRSTHLTIVGIHSIELVDGDWLSVFEAMREQLKLQEFSFEALTARAHWWQCGWYTGEPQKIEGIGSDDYEALSHIARYVSHKDDVNKTAAWTEKDWRDALGEECILLYPVLDTTETEL
jgi:F-box-like